MGQVVRAPLYVPTPTVETNWTGIPKGVPIVLLAALVTLPNFFLNPTRQLRPAEETYWRGAPSTFSAALSQLPAQPPFTSKPTRKFDYVAEPLWLGEPTSRPLSLVLPPSAVQPFSNPRRFDFVETIPGFKSIPFGTTVNPIVVLPFQNFRRTEHVPEPFWVGKPSPVPSPIILPPPVVLPFHNSPWQGPIPTPDWVEGGGFIPQVLLQFPAQPPFTVKGTRKFNLVPEPYWTGEPTPVSLLYTIVPQAVLPFHNTPWQGPIPTPDWVEGGGSIPQVLLQFPAQPPFTVRGTLQFNYSPEPVWIGTPRPVSLSAILPPAVALSFANIRREDVVPDPTPRRASNPIPPVLLQLPAQPPFTVKGTRQFVIPDFVPWSMHGKGSATIFLPITVLQPLETLKNSITRVRSLRNSIQRVRTLQNSVSRRKP